MRIDYRYRWGEPDIWNTIDVLAKREGCPGGVYRVHASRMIDGEPAFAQVSRLLGTDAMGRLYIGKADDFKDRFIGLLKSLNPEYRTSSHGFAAVYNGTPKLRNAHPLDSLLFTLTFSRDPRGEERAELADYATVFGELPPFNAFG